MAKTRKLRGSSRKRTAGSKNKKGGSLLGSVVGALKTALPTIVLYEALRVQGKRTKKSVKKLMKGGKKRKARKSHKKRVQKKHKARKSHKKSHKKRKARKSHKKRMHKKRKGRKSRKTLKVHRRRR
jgi:biopolymer transport protein ExbB/TolQ